MNLGIASSSGRSQDPLNYLQRSITKSTRLTKLGKKHVKLLVRKLKANGPYALEESVTRALWMRAYSELVRVQDKLDTLDIMDKAYKPTVWALCKLSEVIAKFKTRKDSRPNRNGQQQGRRTPPLSPATRPTSVPQEPDADTP